MSVKSPLHSLANQLVDKFNASGRPLTSSSCHQLLHAAIGSVAPEVAAAKNIPIQVCRDPDTRQYNLYATIQRAEKRLGVSYFQAVGVAEEIIESLRTAGIGVNQVQLLLDTSIPKKVKVEAFKALRKNLELNDDGAELTPKTATLALAAGLIPQPETSWKARFSLAGAYPSRGPSELVELVTKSECYLWVLPPTDHPATSFASHDRYFGEQRTPSAEMGMGFSIIQAGRVRPKHPLHRDPAHGTYTQYFLHAPMWSWRAASSTWGIGNILRSDIRDGAPWTNERLSDVLPGGLASLPRIHGCHTCRMLFIDKASGYPDVPTHCLCNEEGKDDGAESPAPNS